MKRSHGVFILSFLLMGPVVSARTSGAYDGMPGKNTIEREIAWAWKMLPGFLKACSNSIECKFSPAQRDLAYKMTRQTTTSEQIQFVSEIDQPALFAATNGETHRLVVTELVPRSMIYINSLRYSQSSRSFGIPFWMGLLAHEWVHHQGITDNADRIPDQLGTLITQASQALLSKAQMIEGRDDVTVYLLNAPMPDSTQTFLDFPDGSSFHVLKVDSDKAIDDVALEILKESWPICEKRKMLNTRVSFESVRLVKDQKSSTAFSGYLILTAEAICINQEQTEAIRMKGGFMNIFGILGTGPSVEAPGDLRLDYATGFSNWGNSNASDGQEAFEVGKISDFNFPKTLSAGSNLEITATIEARPDLKVIGCSANLGSTAWPQMLSAAPLSVLPDSCELTLLSPGKYQVKMLRFIPAETPSMDLQIYYLCLTIPETEANCIPAYPVKKSFVRIVNPNQVPALSIEEFKFQESTLSFKIKNGIGLEYLMLTVGGGDSNGDFVFRIALIGGPNDGVTSSEISQVGPDLLVRVRLKLLRYKGSLLNYENLEELTIITRDLKSLYVNLVDRKLSLPTKRGAN